MEPEPGNPQEVEGVLNPAAARGPDGNLYLFPRLVAKGNYSRIGIARVRFNAAGDPAGVERLGIALEPEADYELQPGGRRRMRGSADHVRGTAAALLDDLRCIFSPRPTDRSGGIGRPVPLEAPGARDLGPYRGHRIRRRGRQGRQPLPRRHSQSIRAPGTGHPSPAAFPRHSSGGDRSPSRSRDVDLERESIWISYCPMPLGGGEPCCLGRFTSHHRLAAPVSPWERLKIGAGTPPILTRHGWLIVYHGVSEIVKSNAGRQLCYSAGVMLLSKEHPRVIRYRSAEPVLIPSLPQERDGTVANVVFPTGIDRRDDLGLPDRFDVYYGMADSRIGVARLDVPDFLPVGGVSDPLEAKV